jgi:dolichol-phosphate mannosyltransferase
MQRPTVSIVIPAHNESGNIRPLLDEIKTIQALANVIEVIFVDDGSTDNTLAELNDARASYLFMRVLSQQPRAGQSAALMTGARAARGDLVVTMDGDGQNDPQSVVDLYQRYNNELPTHPNLGMVAGQRIKVGFSAGRRFSSWAANNIRAALLGDGIKGACSLRLLRRDIYIRLPYFAHMHRYMVALVQREGFDVLPHPVKHRPRRLGATKYTTLNRALVGIIDLMGVMWLKRRGQVPHTIKETI